MIKNQFYNFLQENKAIQKTHVFNSVSDTVDEILIYDYIGEFWGEGVSSAWLHDQIANSTKPELHIRINSGGGSVFEGRAMATSLRNSKANVTAYVDGLCASAATTVALACNKIVMSDGSMFMIHNAHSMGFGDKNEFLKEAALLEKLDIDIAKDYSDKTNIALDDIKTLMNDETWYSATDAKEAGFIDEIENERKVNNIYNLSAFNKAPTIEPEKIEPVTEEPVTEEPKQKKDMHRIMSQMAKIRKSICE